MSIAISIEHLSKAYRLGQIGTGTFANDLRLWWAKTRGKPNPLLKIGEKDHGNRDSETIWALKDVSFTVEQGEVLGIIGRNGAGKSTLLKILSRVTAPTSGRIRVKGRVASLLEVGTGFHPELTGRENIYLNGAILGMSRKEIDRKFDEIVDFAEIEKFIDTPVKRYSSGMYVRLAFAVAAHLEPEILVVDEVLAVGDAEFQKKCLGKMSDVAQGGRTVLFVSHNMAMVINLCRNCLLLSNGILIRNSQTEQVISDYLTLDKKQTSLDSKYISEIRSYGSNKEEKQKFGIGEGITFALTLKNKSDISAISIGINNAFSQRITTLHSNFINFRFSQASRLFCHLDSLVFAPGQYGLTVAFGSSYEQLESVTLNDFFEIVPTDYWGTGKLPTSSQGIVVSKYSWHEER